MYPGCRRRRITGGLRLRLFIRGSYRHIMPGQEAKDQEANESIRGQRWETEDRIKG